ncbi:hypothetical protein GCM10010378_59250 [Streptomyces viridochromogenes]
MRIEAYTAIEILGPRGRNPRRGTACAGCCLIAMVGGTEGEVVVARLMGHFRQEGEADSSILDRPVYSVRAGLVRIRHGRTA